MPETIDLYMQIGNTRSGARSTMEHADPILFPQVAVKEKGTNCKNCKRILPNFRPRAGQKPDKSLTEVSRIETQHL